MMRLSEELKPLNVDDLKLLMGELTAAYPNAKVSAATVGVYAKSLCDLSLKALQFAVSRHISESEFFPSVAELRRAAADFNEGSIPPALEAWGEVCTALASEVSRNMGVRPKLTNPIAQKIADAMGWRRLYHYQGFLEKEFIRAYEEAADRHEERRTLPPQLRAELEQREALRLTDGVDRKLLTAGDYDDFLDLQEEGDR